VLTTTHAPGTKKEIREIKEEITTVHSRIHNCRRISSDLSIPQLAPLLAFYTLPTTAHASIPGIPASQKEQAMKPLRRLHVFQPYTPQWNMPYTHTSKRAQDQHLPETPINSHAPPQHSSIHHRPPRLTAPTSSEQGSSPRTIGERSSQKERDKP
jgi:hypothetical protein